MAYVGSPPADRILSSADIAQGAVTLNDINFTDVPTNMDITGTIDKHTMRLAEGVTITGDVTISDDLVLAKISDDGVAITMTNDGSSRTITGSGSIQAGTIIATPQPTQTYAVGTTLTGLTGVIGAGVTGGAGLDGATIADNSVTLAKIADNSVTLAKMSGGTDGELITYNTSGDPATVAVGTSGHVLTSGGTGVAPTFQAAVSGSAVGSIIQTTTDTNATTNTDCNQGNDTWTDTVLTASITTSGATNSVIVHGDFSVYLDWNCVGNCTGAGYSFRFKKVHSGGTSYPNSLSQYGWGSTHGSEWIKGTTESLSRHSLNLIDDACGVAGAVTYTLQCAEYNCASLNVGSLMGGRWHIWFQEVKR